MKNYNKILEAINKGIQFALDDFESDDIKLSKPKQNTIDKEDSLWKVIKFNEQYIDLGLPSGTIWAKYNIGADIDHLDTPIAWYGKYYAWGELEPNKPEGYKWENYKWVEKDGKIVFDNGKAVLSKYNVNTPSFNNTKKIPDNLSQLEPEDDIAYIQTNGEMRIPTKQECEELLKNTEYSYISHYKNIAGLNGFIFKSLINGNELFIPCAGYKHTYNSNSANTYTSEVGEQLCIWTSTPKKDSDEAYSLSLSRKAQNTIKVIGNERYNGFSIHPVKNLKNSQIDVEIEQKVLTQYEHYKNLTIQSQELKRLNNKYVLIDDKFLQQILSKRIYNNITFYLANDEMISYQKFYNIMKKHGLKILGGKKFGYPEIEFSPTDPRI